MEKSRFLLERNKQVEHCWSYGVTVSNLGFESSDGGSNPPGTFLGWLKLKSTDWFCKRSLCVMVEARLKM